MTSRQSDGSFPGPSAATARLETVLVAEVPGLVRGVFSTLADRQQESVQIDMVDVFTNASINTRNGLLGGKLENGCECYRTVRRRTMLRSESLTFSCPPDTSFMAPSVSAP